MLYLSVKVLVTGVKCFTDLGKLTRQVSDRGTLLSDRRLTHFYSLVTSSMYLFNNNTTSITYNLSNIRTTLVELIDIIESPWTSAKI